MSIDCFAVLHCSYCSLTCPHLSDRVQRGNYQPVCFRQILFRTAQYLVQWTSCFKSQIRPSRTTILCPLYSPHTHPSPPSFVHFTPDIPQSFFAPFYPPFANFTHLHLSTPRLCNVRVKNPCKSFCCAHVLDSVTHIYLVQTRWESSGYGLLYRESTRQLGDRCRRMTRSFW